MGYREIKRDRIDKIYENYKDDVYKVCYHYLKDAGYAHEMAQETFFHFYKHMDQTDIKCVQAYLIRSARNLCLNYRRDHKDDMMGSSWDAIEENSFKVLSVEEVYFRGELKKQRAELSDSILERLKEENENWYTAMNMAYCLGKPQDVIADEMGISVEALYSMIYRAKKWIRKNYTSQMEEINKES